MVIGAEDVDHPVESADEELVAVVREVAAEVGDVAVRLHEHPVPRVAELARLEPGCAVSLVDESPARGTVRSSRATAPDSSTDAWLYQLSKTIPRDSRVVRICSRIRVGGELALRLRRPRDQ